MNSSAPYSVFYLLVYVRARSYERFLGIARVGKFRSFKKKEFNARDKMALTAG